MKLDNTSALLEKAAPALLFAQELPPRPVYNLNWVSDMLDESRQTAYRRIKSLVPLGLATYNRGRFQLKKETLSQPLNVLNRLMQSLLALQKGRRFGRSYNKADINFVLKHVPESSITLDYKAWDLTKFQLPNDLYVYADDLEKESSFLKKNGFSEGKKGHVILLPKLGIFENMVERVYLDCIANGGRSILDAIAIQLLYKDQINVKGRFPIETILKVQEDMPKNNLRDLAPTAA